MATIWSIIPFSFLLPVESLAVITKSLGDVGYTKYNQSDSLSKLNISINDCW